VPVVGGVATAVAVSESVIGLFLGGPCRCPSRRRAGWIRLPAH